MTTPHPLLDHFNWRAPSRSNAEQYLDDSALGGPLQQVLQEILDRGRTPHHHSVSTEEGMVFVRFFGPRGRDEEYMLVWHNGRESDAARSVAYCGPTVRM